jgi:hypothetical protein
VSAHGNTTNFVAVDPFFFLSRVDRPRYNSVAPNLTQIYGALLMFRKVLLCTVVAGFGFALACGKSSQAPTSPSSAVQGDSAAAADGSTLKATAPTPVSPVNGAQPDTLVFTANAAQSKFANAALLYQLQIRSGSNTVYDSQAAGVSLGANGNTVTLQPATSLTPDTNYTWRIRALYQGAFGPWSSDATFKAPVGGYIRGAELFDPLVGRRTVGALQGGATLTDEGVFLPEHESHVDYVLQDTLVNGEFSMMIKGLSTSQTRGAKSKVFSMQEGFGDITTNDYRATIDWRARAYPDPGAVTFRIITGDAGDRVFDGPRIVVGGWDPNTWYFWRFSWHTGTATLEVRQGNEAGPLKYIQSINTGTHEYRPTPHVLHLGQPLGRGGDDDATATGITIKSVWASGNPRPAFPQ